MKESLPTFVARKVKPLVGIEDFSLFRKNLRKRIGKVFYHRKYSAGDIVRCMCDMGMQKGSVVCIHAAMREFYNYQGTAEELIDLILETITCEGTLIMPAFPPYKWQRDPEYIFNSGNDRTDAGYLAETFRKYPGVMRSINVRHSVCAIGKHAKELTEGHQNCANCWDKDSPWYRMTRLNAIVFNLGMPASYIGTFDHCVEGTLYNEHPYWKQFFNRTDTFRYYDDKGSIASYTCLNGDLEQRSREKRLIRYFDSNEYKKARISNLFISAFQSRTCLDKMIELGRKGITMYYVPSPKAYSF